MAMTFLRGILTCPLDWAFNAVQCLAYLLIMIQTRGVGASGILYSSVQYDRPWYIQGLQAERDHRMSWGRKWMRNMFTFAMLATAFITTTWDSCRSFGITALWNSPETSLSGNEPNTPSEPQVFWSGSGALAPRSANHGCWRFEGEDSSLQKDYYLKFAETGAVYERGESGTAYETYGETGTAYDKCGETGTAYDNCGETGIACKKCGDIGIACEKCGDIGSACEKWNVTRSVGRECLIAGTGTPEAGQMQLSFCLVCGDLDVVHGVPEKVSGAAVLEETDENSWMQKTKSVVKEVVKPTGMHGARKTIIKPSK